VQRTETCSGVVQVLRQSYYLVLLIQSKVGFSGPSPSRCPVLAQLMIVFAVLLITQAVLLSLRLALMS